MTLEEIKSAVDNGQIVRWATTRYRVVKSNADYLITCQGQAIGLTWADGVTLNGKEKDFYIDHPFQNTHGNV